MTKNTVASIYNVRMCIKEDNLKGDNQTYLVLIVQDRGYPLVI